MSSDGTLFNLNIKWTTAECWWKKKSAKSQHTSRVIPHSAWTSNSICHWLMKYYLVFLCLWDTTAWQMMPMRVESWYSHWVHRAQLRMVTCWKTNIIGTHATCDVCLHPQTTFNITTRTLSKALWMQFNISCVVVKTSWAEECNSSTRNHVVQLFQWRRTIYRAWLRLPCDGARLTIRGRM